MDQGGLFLFFVGIDRIVCLVIVDILHLLLQSSTYLFHDSPLHILSILALTLPIVTLGPPRSPLCSQFAADSCLRTVR
jgi:hypothetical protein